MKQEIKMTNYEFHHLIKIIKNVIYSGEKNRIPDIYKVYKQNRGIEVVFVDKKYEPIFLKKDYLAVTSVYNIL